MQILQNYDLTRHSTFNLPVKAAFFATAYTLADIEEAYIYTVKNQLGLLPLGKGSNIIFGNEFIDKFILEIDITGLEVNEESLIKIGAGEIWDEVVAKAVNMNLAGIECLSAIPGTAGATPVQNVGAYGQEISDTLVKLTAFDLKSGKLVELNKSDCLFGYRDSIFKNKDKGRYIITDLTLKLEKDGPPTVTYESLSTYLQKNDLTNPTLQDIRQVVMAIRAIKLPDPSVIPNAGSFFKNPIVEKKLADKLKRQYSDLPVYNIDSENVKLPAGWIIEQCGLKGIRKGHFGTYENNSLVLIHHGGGTISELEELVEFIKLQVKSKFNIELHQEPETIL